MGLLISYAVLWAITSSVSVAGIAIWSTSRTDQKQADSEHSIAGFVCAGIWIGAIVTSLIAVVHLW